ncbi:MAG: DNA repair exonuclease [Firmicutes bacterium]|jgi:DNA repair exonuclease SbcCD nuclease subunit|nr:DNA repair exonuclease [Bacillota bacterium]HPU01373.1 DNA repair exonuclease [Bacillota bacterium]
MSLKVFHTADLHLGMTFRNRGYPEEVRQQLVEARYEALERMVELANAEKCRLFIVAGDLFHRAQPPPEAIARAVRSLSRFQGDCVALLPGNHDYCDGYGSLWKELRELAPDSLLLLTDTVPYPLHDYGIDAVLYPAPCHRKHSRENRLGWIRQLAERPAARWHLGVAHGTVRGISPDLEDEYFPMEESELAGLRLDHCFLGHTHVRHPDLEEVQGALFCFSGTPEPDGFDCRHGGSAWITTLDENGVHCRAVATGKFRFMEISRELRGASGLDELEEELRQVGKRSLVKLRLSGFLPEEAYNNRRRRLDEMRSAVLYLEDNDSDLAVELSAEFIAARFPAGSFPQRLLSRLAQKNDPAALQLAYRLINEVKR